MLSCDIFFFSFLNRDQLSWVQGILALVSSDELAFDVAGAEALLDRQQVLLHCFLLFVDCYR